MEDNRRFCDVCGAPLEGGERFCIACGTPIDGTQPITSAAGYPTQPTQPYAYPPPVKKSPALAISLGVGGGLLVLILVVGIAFVALSRGKEISNSAPPSSGSTAVTSGNTDGGNSASSGSANSGSDVVAAPPLRKPTLDDFPGTWIISTVDLEPVAGTQYQDIRVEGGEVKFVYQGYNLSFNLSILGDGSLQGEARTGGGEIFLAQGKLYNQGKTLQVYMPAPDDPNDHLFEITLFR